MDGATVNRFADAVRARDFTCVSALLEIRPELVNMALAENDERRPLHFAVLDRSSEMVRLLLHSGDNARKGRSGDQEGSSFRKKTPDLLIS